MNKESSPTSSNEADVKIALEKAKKAELEAKLALLEKEEAEFEKADTDEKAALLEKLEEAGAPADTLEFMKKTMETDAVKQEKIDALTAETQAILSKEEEANRLDKRMKEIGLSEKDFSKFPEWATFTHGQKMLVLEQAAQETLSKVKDTAVNRFTEKNQMKFSWNPTKWNPLSLANKMRKNMTKAYFVAKEEKTAVLDAAQGDIVPGAQTLKSLTERMADMDLPVVEGADGKAVIEFEGLEKNLTPELKAVVENYNKIANEFSRMPDSWKNEKAAADGDTFANHNFEQYQAKKAEYEAAKALLIQARTAQFRGEATDVKAEANDLKTQDFETEDKIKELMLGVKDNDFRIAMLQFSNTIPDAIGELRNIHNSSAFKKIFKDNETIWRGIYMGAGAASKWAAATTLGALTGPLVASIIGGARARRKANEKINEAFNDGREEGTFLERRAQGLKGAFEDKTANAKGLMTNIMPGMTAVNAKEVAAFVDADSQMQRVNNLIGKIDAINLSINTRENMLAVEDELSEDVKKYLADDINSKILEKAEITRQLTARLDFIEQKREAGLINYGKDNSVALNYAFLKLMSEAEVKSEVFNEKAPLDLTPDQIQAIYKLDDRREKLTEYVENYNKLQREFNQTYFKNTETARGAVIGATFGVLGAKIMGMFHHAPASGLSYEHTGTTSTEFTAGTGSVREAVTPAAPNVHNAVSAVVGKGEGAIKTIRELQKNLGAEYKNISEAPASVQHILNTKADKLAMEYGMYKPGQAAESALTQVRGEIDVDANGNVIYHQTQGDAGTLLERANEAKGSGLYEGRMLDTDHSGAAKHAIEQGSTKTGASSALDKNINKDVIEQSDPETVKPNVEDTVPKPPASSEVIDQKDPESVIAKTGTVTAGGGVDKDTLPPPADQTGDLPVQKNPEVIIPKTGTVTAEGVKDNLPPPTGQTAEVNNLPGDRPLPPPANQPAAPATPAAPVNKPNVFEQGVKAPTARVDIEGDPRHLKDLADIREKFGRDNVIIDRSKDDMTNGMDTKEWNKNVDHMLETKEVKIGSYAEYEKERELQELFGKGTRTEGIEYSPELDKNVHAVHVSLQYFRDTPEWPTVSKIPAKEFFDLDHATISPEQMKELVKSGVATEYYEADGIAHHSFSHIKELQRLQKVYEKFAEIKSNAKPIGDEPIEKYIARLTRDIHKTQNGTIYILKGDAGIKDKILGDGSVVKQEAATLPRTNTPRIGSVTPANGIYPGAGIYPNDTPTRYLARQAVSNILNFVNSRINR